VSLSILAGLGFGLTDFALNVLTLGAPFIAILPWMFFHASSAGITAYGIAKNRVMPFYLISVGLHATSGLFASTGNLLWYVIGPTLLLITFLLAWNFLSQNHRNYSCVALASKAISPRFMPAAAQQHTWREFAANV
jgi:hypothetical protein